ncbi:multicopper oxidase domain-containing protein [Agrococcus beijingensis]|uniref:multicopper oxidase domain-containing protein n=1 Tax=Agrococcus beijingensis TaxID=3068634 RepID=UPI002740F1EE|nr:multicopper oxidase domain-containing protein [Agrococcus sp. REN33]
MQLIQVNGSAIDGTQWRDVVNVPAQGSVVVRIDFARFTGLTVYHCHILGHEDLGMMGTVKAAA